jgi:glucose/arabinose dehydrogenase
VTACSERARTAEASLRSRTTLRRAFVVSVLLGVLGPPAGRAALPSGFSRVRVASGLDQPTAFTFASDRILVTEKSSGRVRIVRPDGTVRRRPYVTLATSTNSERGVLGIAVDPNFTANPFVYVFYTTGPGALNYGGSPKNRVSRFATSNGVGTQEKILLDGIPSDAGNHNGGDIHFGFDGKLYIAVGDGGTFHDQAQVQDSLRGKILRINRDGTIPADNPFYVTNTGKRRAVFAHGFRNPFRFTGRESNQTYIVADVGQNTWEEVDALQAGGNFGWSDYEGPCPANDPRCDPGTTDFGGTIAPIHFYAHGGAGETGNVIIGGVFAEGSNYPSPYAGAYFYGDNGAGWVHALTMDASNVVTSRYDFDQLGCPVSFGVGPDGNVYVADICSGTIDKYVYTP